VRKRRTDPFLPPEAAPPADAIARGIELPELPPAFDPVTDEVNALPSKDSELAMLSGEFQSFERTAKSEGGQAEDRRAKSKRSQRRMIMIQSAAAVAVSVVVINSSLGLDLIGDDALSLNDREIAGYSDSSSGGSSDDGGGSGHGSSEVWLSGQSAYRSRWYERDEYSDEFYEEYWEEPWHDHDKPGDEPWIDPTVRDEEGEDQWDDPVIDEPGKDGYADIADRSFPTLSNLSPNGYAEGYGVLNEQYVRLERMSDDGEVIYTWICAGSAYGLDPERVAGITYNEDENTLYLENFSCDVLNINMMGNGFRINVSGNCTVGHLLVWGFHYGGSVTLTGSGTLTVNQDREFEYGILFEAEESESALMIEPGVRLDAYGTRTAIYIKDSTAEKGIWYLSPLTMVGGRREPENPQTDGSPHSFYITGEFGMVDHVVFE